MALVGVLVTPDGVTHAEAYARIVKISMDWELEVASVVVKVYHNESTRFQGLLEVETVIYEFLKTPNVSSGQPLPAFSQVFSLEALAAYGGNQVQVAYSMLKTFNMWQSWGDG